MKKINYFLFFILLAANIVAQNKPQMNVLTKDGKTTPFYLENITDITFTTTLSTIYSEDFTINPNYTVNPDVASNDIVEWDASGFYRVKINEDGSPNGKQKFAYSPTFSEVNNMSFSLTVDLRNSLQSWGHEASFLLCKTDNSPTPQIGGTGKQPALQIWRDDVMHKWYVQDTLSHQWMSPIDDSNGHWYRFAIDYDAPSKKVNITITDLEAGTSVLNVTNQDCTFGNFNRVVLGEQTAFWDGTICETDYDNIIISPK